MRPTVTLVLASALFAAVAVAAHGQSLQNSGSAASGVPDRPGNTMMPHREAAPAPSGRMPQGAAAQDRELDSIGNKLLRETPKNPPADSVSTGGGTVAPH